MDDKEKEKFGVVIDKEKQPESDQPKVEENFGSQKIYLQKQKIMIFLKKNNLKTKVNLMNKSRSDNFK